ncbi:hypothetical protein I7I51_03027 [Histoplasma capsulatum]|uniref:Uncharacterized protein n=1 Tax=Ajellomyces capsulatus TaxID=5037 RepID=A0A8A1MLW0_AJECA|nr:hypothetical protein I7I51_03027 [Histoplasma capsulatum]
MAVTLNTSGAAGFPQIIKALQRLQHNPELLTRERSMFNDPPPPYRGASWKHEESPEPEPQPGPDRSISISDPLDPRPKIVSEECRAAHEHETRAFRPYYQFLYQISKEREWLEDEPDSGCTDIDVQAYENVKNRWLTQKIWNPQWGNDMPGMTWIHEVPDDEDSDDDRPVCRVRYMYRSHEVPSASPEPTGEAGLPLTSKSREEMETLSQVGMHLKYPFPYPRALKIQRNLKNLHAPLLVQMVFQMLESVLLEILQILVYANE